MADDARHGKGVLYIGNKQQAASNFIILAWPVPREFDVNCLTNPLEISAHHSKQEHANPSGPFPAANKGLYAINRKAPFLPIADAKHNSRWACTNIIACASARMVSSRRGSPLPYPFPPGFWPLPHTTFSGVASYMPSVQDDKGVGRKTP